MRGPGSAVAAAVAVAALAVPAPPAAAAEACTDLEVVAVRGTQEPGTVGPTLQPVADAIEAGTERSVTLHGLPYPAAPMSLSSPDEGVTMLAERVEARTAQCPDMRFVLLGYSQGAMVVGDALAGTAFGFASPRIPESLAPRIGAVVVFGSGYFRAGYPYNRGTSVTENPGVGSIFPRQGDAMETYADRLADYCDAGDLACQSSPKGPDGHTGYARYGADAAAFVLATLDAQERRPAPAPRVREFDPLVVLACGALGAFVCR